MPRVTRGLALAVTTGLAVLLALGAPLASAEPVAEPPPPPVDGWAPSSPPVATTFPDGYTLALSATQETQVPVPPLTAEQTSHDVIVGGIFSGSVRKPGSWATPSGTLEVGYQVGCDHPNGMMFFMIDQFKRGQNDVSITQQKFTGADPKVEISGYRLHIDRCPGEAFIRSYAILTREGDQSGSVVYYYGVPKIV